MEKNSDKIICSLEEWDTIIDYYRPNASSKTWYIKELKRLSRPLMWGDWNLITEQGEMFGNDILRGLVTTEYSKRIEYTPIDKITDKHIYVITIWNVNFFTENYDIGFSCISEKYLQDIKEGRSKIVMLHLYEGYSGSKGNNDLETIEKWRTESNLPLNSIYYVSGNLLCEKIVEYRKFGYIGKGTHSFEPWNRYNPINGPIKFKPIDNKDIFLNYNRNPRHQRLFLLSKILESNLFERGRISLNKLIHSDPPNVNPTSLEYFKTNAPFVIDRDYNLDFNLAIDITIEDYEKTFLSLVSESLVDDECLFVTEKIFKPILVGHPFIIYGNQHTLKYLKELGYKTFGKWIDESYDDESNCEVRALMITNEIKKLSEKTTDELVTIREEMKEVCIFNQMKFKELYDEKYGQDNLNKEIVDIFNDVWDSLKN
jgi:hypothetical protein